MRKSGLPAHCRIASGRLKKASRYRHYKAFIATTAKLLSELSASMTSPHDASIAREGQGGERG